MKRRGNKPRPKHQELQLDELKAILERAATGAPLEARDLQKLAVAIDTLAFLTSELEAKGASIGRLRRWLFGASTEKTSRVVGEGKSDAAGASGTAKGESGAKQKQKGHGRNDAESYRGAEQVKVPHAMLHTGDRCPLCEKGKVYVQAEPAVLAPTQWVNTSRHALQRRRSW